MPLIEGAVVIVFLALALKVIWAWNPNASTEGRPGDPDEEKE